MRIQLAASSSILILLAATLARPVAAQCQTQRLAPPAGPEELGFFGGSVDVAGDTLVVGEYGRDEVPTRVDSGVVHVYRRTLSGTWFLLQQLEPPSAPGGQFGSFVAIEGDLIAVGAPGYQRSGAVFFFKRTPSGFYAADGMIRATDARDGQLYGSCVALQEGTLLVGAGWDRPFGATQSGAVYAYERTPYGWFETQKLLPRDPGEHQLFGICLALDGDRALAGATTFVEGVPGSVYVLERRRRGWVEVARLEPPDARANTYGRRIDLEGDVAVVRNEEITHVFELREGVWTETARFVHDFSGGVSISGGRIAIGVDGYDPAVNSFGSETIGRVRIVERVAGVWTETGELVQEDADAKDYFGSNVLLAGNEAFIFSFEGDHFVPLGFSGALYAWELEACALGAQSSALSVTQGGEVRYAIDAGAANAGRVYWLLGTTAGTEPGLAVRGAHLPLNFDGPGGYFLRTLRFPNRPPLASSRGILDAAGRASASFSLPPASDPALVGTTLHHACVVLDLSAGGAPVFVSEPLHTHLQP